MMDLTFDIENSKGDQLLVALSYYDSEILGKMSHDADLRNLIFYDVALTRIKGTGLVGYRMLHKVSEILANFLLENKNAILCFYCDPNTELERTHISMPPQEYRSILFSKMFDMYTRKHDLAIFLNHQVIIEDIEIPAYSQYVHFIGRKDHLEAINKMDVLLKEK